MVEFTVDTPFQKIYDLPEVKPLAPYFIWRHAPKTPLVGTTTLREKGSGSPNRDINAQCDGVNYLLSRLLRGDKVLYDVYSPEEVAEDPEKEPVKLMFFPPEKEGAGFTEKAKQTEIKPFILLCPGGGYNAVCSVIEGFSTAQELNALGYPVFLLNYRVGYEHLMPAPFDDLAAGLKYIFAHADELGVSKENYAVGGFSAGGHLAAEWGTDNFGYARYGLPKPAALVLVYAVIDRWLKVGEEAAMDRIYGGHTREILERFSVNKHAGSGYPPTFLVHCKDDPEVPVQNSLILSDVLDGLGIPNELMLGEKGGHGFGSGRSTDAVGWTKRAAAFWERQMH